MNKYLLKFDFPTDQAIFLDVDRSELRSSPFLDQRIHCKRPKPENIALQDCLDSLQKSDQGLSCSYIFHTAYCCSTLLSRAMDFKDKVVVFREPVTLHQLAVMKRRSENFRQVHLDRWELYLQLCNKLYASINGGESRGLVKLTDSCNNIIHEVVSMTKQARALLLYSSLEEFIVSNIKSDGRLKFLENFVMRAEKDAETFPELSKVEARELSGAGKAAYVWIVNILHYISALEKNPQLVTLNSEDMLAQPHCFLKRVADQLDLGLSLADINFIVEDDVWNRHAKDGSKQVFTSDDRKQEKVSILERYSRELAQAVDWVGGLVDLDNVNKVLRERSI